jgi:hypothetical protein
LKNDVGSDVFDAIGRLVEAPMGQSDEHEHERNPEGDRKNANRGAGFAIEDIRQRKIRHVGLSQPP